jgi:hypothetical protein
MGRGRKHSIISCHQGEWEAELAREACAASGISVSESVLEPRNYPGYGRRSILCMCSKRKWRLLSLGLERDIEFSRIRAVRVRIVCNGDRGIAAIEVILRNQDLNMASRR